MNKIKNTLIHKLGGVPSKKYKGQKQRADNLSKALDLAEKRALKAELRAMVFQRDFETLKEALENETERCTILENKVKTLREEFEHLVELREANEASILPAPKSEPAPEPDREEENPKQSTPTKGKALTASNEKKATYDRLKAYREANGIGSFLAIANLCPGLTDNEIRMMYDCVKFPVTAWRKVSKALDKLEGQNGVC